MEFSTVIIDGFIAALKGGISNAVTVQELQMLKIVIAKEKASITQQPKGESK
jgi:hypothetical protein